MLVSFDVSSLFTNVPIDEALQVIRDRLRGDETLVNRTTLSPDRVAELLESCLRSNYFCYGGEFHEQQEGAAMGSPVSAVVANLYMEFRDGGLELPGCWVAALKGTAARVDRRQPATSGDTA